MGRVLPSFNKLVLATIKPSSPYCLLSIKTDFHINFCLQDQSCQYDTHRLDCKHSSSLHPCYACLPPPICNTLQPHLGIFLIKSTHQLFQCPWYFYHLLPMKFHNNLLPTKFIPFQCFHSLHWAKTKTKQDLVFLPTPLSGC